MSSFLPSEKAANFSFFPVCKAKGKLFCIPQSQPNND